MYVCNWMNLYARYSDKSYWLSTARLKSRFACILISSSTDTVSKIELSEPTISLFQIMNLLALCMCQYNLWIWDTKIRTFQCIVIHCDAFQDIFDNSKVTQSENVSRTATSMDDPFPILRISTWAESFSPRILC